MIIQHAGVARMGEGKTFIPAILKMIAAFQRSLLITEIFWRAQRDLLADPRKKIMFGLPVKINGQLGLFKLQTQVLGAAR